MPPSDKHFLYHLIISQLYHDGFGHHAELLEEQALDTSRAVPPSDRLSQIIAMCAHTVREVDTYFEGKTSEKQYVEEEAIVKRSCFTPSERPLRSSTPSSFHTFARKRLTAAKRHSVMSMNRAKHARSSPKMLFSTTFPKTSHVPIIYPAANSPEQTLQESSNPIQSLFVASSQTERQAMLFPGDEEKVHTAEAVRVIQNIFQQKPDFVPQASPALDVESKNIEIPPKDVSILPDNSDIIETPSPTGSHNSSMSMVEEKRKSPFSVEHMEITTPSTETPSRVSAFSPPSRISSMLNTTQASVETLRGSAAHDTSDREERQRTLSEGSNPVTPPDRVQSDECADSLHSSESCDSRDDMKEGILISAGDGEEPLKIYTSNSQDIIKQLNSLSASGIGNIQNLANTLTNSFCEGQLQEGNLGLSSLSMESLASSLSLSVANVSGLGEGQQAMSRVVGGFGGVGPGNFLSRLEGDSPSMLSMMSGQHRPTGSGNTPPMPGKRFQCPHCSKCYASYDCLSRHKRIHTGANKKTCPTCFRLFFRADHFKTHTSTCSKKSSPGKSSPSDTQASVPEGGQDPAGVLNISYRPHQYLWASQIGASQIGSEQVPNGNGIANMPRITGIHGRGYIKGEI